MVVIHNPLEAILPEVAITLHLLEAVAQVLLEAQVAVDVPAAEVAEVVEVDVVVAVKIIHQTTFLSFYL